VTKCGKIDYFKIQNGGGRRLKKIEKSCYLKTHLTDFDEIQHSEASRPSGPNQPIKLRTSKIQDGVAGILKNRKIANTVPWINKFDEIRQDPGPLEPVSQ